MASLNRVFLMGNLTRDPELRYGGGGGGAAGGGSAICKFGLAVNRQWRDANGQNQEETTFVDITVFARQAETCNEYLKKGRPVFIEGRLNFSTWEDRETHQKRSKLDVVAERVQFLGSPGGGGAPREAGGDEGGGYAPRAPRTASTPGGAPAVGAGGAPAPSPATGGSPAPRSAPGAAPGAASGGGRQGAEGVDFDDIP